MQNYHAEGWWVVKGIHRKSQEDIFSFICFIQKIMHWLHKVGNGKPALTNGK